MTRKNITYTVRNDAPYAELCTEEGCVTLFLRGAWTVYTLEEGRQALHSLKTRERGKYFEIINLDNVTHIDTSGALLINSIPKFLAKERQPVIQARNADFHTILELSKKAARPKKPREPLPNIIIRICNNAGQKIFTELALVRDILSFFGLFVIRMLQSVRKPKEINIAALVNQLEQAGIRAVPIVALLNFLIGLVIAYMAAAQLLLFGAQIFVVNLLEIGVLREMGVLITAIMVAGRSGSAFTAQIGAMVSNEEVKAMQCMGIDPMLRLVIPRVLALIIGMPFLVIVADIMALLGGMCAMWFSMNISPTVFINTLHESITLRHVLVGVLKAPFFAVVISCVGCFLGFKATGSSDSIGALTTRSVVESIFLVIMLDALFALALTTIGV